MAQHELNLRLDIPCAFTLFYSVGLRTKIKRSYK